jgi:hypothetical protein
MLIICTVYELCNVKIGYQKIDVYNKASAYEFMIVE